jgi:hypothetical protein
MEDDIIVLLKITAIFIYLVTYFVYLALGDIYY